MAKKPNPPAEAVVLQGAFQRLHDADRKFSWREVARRAGVSEGWVRQVKDGVQSAGQGNYIVRRAPDDTLAAIARALQVPIGELSKAGRQDADGILARMSMDDAAFDDAVTLQQQIQDWAEDPLVLMPPRGILSLFDDYTLNQEVERRRNPNRDASLPKVQGN